MTEPIALADERAMDWREFLTDRPPGARAHAEGSAHAPPGRTPYPIIPMPELRLYCDGDCKSTSYCHGQSRGSGILFGSVQKEVLLRDVARIAPVDNVPYDVILCYTCEKCGRAVKSYLIRFWTIAPASEVRAKVDVQKVAEWPAFSPRTPSKLTALIGPDRNLFLKGRQAESEGLGIGAFSYYRCIVEGQKNRLLDEIIRVAAHIGAHADILATLEAAKAEIQFSKAVESVKDAIPSVLCIKGHNPFTLLHGALSSGLHAASDEDCLVAANDVRLILVELAERLSEAMKEQHDLDAALTRLVNRKKQLTPIT